MQHLELYKLAIIPDDYQQEIKAIATMTPFSENEVLLANLYYDALKFYFGCTAFATYANGQMWHARNLDWHTENDLLAKHTRIFDFTRNGQVIFKTVGWPGYIGCLSGMKPRAFSVTLNAVLSNDAPEIAYPISFLLRDVLEKASDYAEARQILSEKTIACDCLLLLSGMAPHEKIVIERTPKRHALRGENDPFVVVTNDYKKLDNAEEDSNNLLQTTSCGRFDRTSELLKDRQRDHGRSFADILKDPEIKMMITVQQMVFDNATGEIEMV